MAILALLHKLTSKKNICPKNRTAYAPKIHIQSVNSEFAPLTPFQGWYPAVAVLLNL